MSDNYTKYYQAELEKAQGQRIDIPLRRDNRDKDQGAYH